MDINYGKQVNVNEIISKEITLFLMASNHEKRVFTAFNKISPNNNILKTIAFCYNSDYLPLKKGDNKISNQVIKSHQEITKLLDTEFSKIVKNEITIIIDYSCMTKSWYYTIILYLKMKNLSFEKVNVYFVYTPSKFTEPLEPKPNTDIAPLPGKYSVSSNDKPKALIVCLGYEQRKAEGIIEHLDPKEYYLFYSKPALDDKFVDKIELNNAAILKKTDNVTRFPLNDLLSIERELTSLYYLLKDEYSIIIAPLGPKPFTFISMLLAIKYTDIDIWRVGSGSDINVYEREPINNETFIISEVVFEKNKE
jgi:hypothetical protein